MKRKLIYLTLVLMLILNGCGGGEDSDPSDSIKFISDSTVYLKESEMAKFKFQVKAESDLNSRLEFQLKGERDAKFFILKLDGTLSFDNYYDTLDKRKSTYQIDVVATVVEGVNIVNNNITNLHKTNSKASEKQSITIIIGKKPTPIPTPKPVVVTSTPRPTALVVTSIPRPTTVVVTSTPRPTAVVVTSTPRPTAVVVTSTPRPTAVVVTSTPRPTAVVVTSTPRPTAVVVTPTPTPKPVVVTPTPTPKPVVVTPTPTSSALSKWNPSIYKGKRSHSINTTNTVKDNYTGLIWQKEGSSNSMNWEDAKTYCRNLNLDSYSDWRLPNMEELYYLGDITRHNPTISEFFNIQSNWYWSATSYKNDSFGAWLVRFRNGGGSWNRKSNNYFVLCVR